MPLQPFRGIAEPIAPARSRYGGGIPEPTAPARSPAVGGIPEPIAPARSRSLGGIPEPVAPARVRPGTGLDSGQVNDDLTNLIVAAAGTGRIAENDVRAMIDNIEVYGRRSIDVSVLYRLVVSRGPLFDPAAARAARVYLGNVTDIGGE